VVEEVVAQIPEPIAQPAPAPIAQPKPATIQNPVPETDPLHEIQQILESTSPNPAQAKSAETAIVEPEVKLEQPVVETPVPTPAPVAVAPEPAPIAVEPEVAINAPNNIAEPSLQPEPYYEEHGAIPAGFSKRRKTQKRFFWTLIILIILGLLGWIAYIVVNGVLDGSLIGQKNNTGPKLNPNSISRQADSENYITIIEASDLSSLITASRGTAQLVKELNIDMIRLGSTRDELNRLESAKPMLIRLKPGVLQQISGKRVTVEIFAKSGSSDTAHFAVGCEFGILTECGRKRFLAGSQPNASVFAFQMDPVNDINQDMYLTLSTDTTSEASVTGKGDILDIVYIRLSVDN